MNPKTHTPLPLENLEALHLQKSELKPSEGPHEKTERKVVGPKRNWLDGSMIGQKFGRLTVVGKALKTPESNQYKVPCLCLCGEVIQVFSTHVARGSLCRKCSGISRRTHGRTPWDVYKIWICMRQRCLNPDHKNWKNYGGRGITVCESWAAFERFRDDMGPRPSKKYSLERINNNAGYSPENCRWATRKEQNRNTRFNRFVKIGDDVKTLAEWVEISGLNKSTLVNRLESGWEAEKVLSPQIRKHDLVCFKGETKSITEWANEYGILRSTVYSRLSRGYSFEEALTTPAQKKNASNSARATARPASCRSCSPQAKKS